MLTKEDLHKFVQEKLGDYLFIVVANRQPYEHMFKRGRVECQRPSGGVITALDPVMQACHGLWIGFGSGDADRQCTPATDKIPVPPEHPTYTLKRIWLTKEEEEGYYYGYSNEALWPLCHMAFQRPVFEQGDWEHYVKVNRKFADAILAEIGNRKAFVWIQDYHLCLLPKFLKEAVGSQLITAHFWHIPWPSYEAFRTCPQKEELLEGLLSNDLIGFHTHYHCNNFLDVADRLLESRIDREHFSIIRKNHETMIRPYPISVDFLGMSEKAEAMDFAKLKDDFNEEFGIGGCRLLLGVDRIDYTKGIPERLRAIDRLLELHPELKGKVKFLQIGVLSRIHIGTYKDLNDEINALVETINWKHSTGGWVPINFVRTHMPMSKLLVLYRMAEVCIVSSLHDGMNLVAKEFISARCDGDGALILSQFTGSAAELTDAVLINPYDMEQFSDGIYRAMRMPEEERRRRMARMRQTVQENNIFRWAGKVLSGLLKIEFKEQRDEKPAPILG